MSAVVVAAAIAPAVLLSSPAFAADGAKSANGAVSVEDGGSQAEQDRAEIERVLADKKSGPILRKAAEQALKGTPAEMRAFLETGRDQAQLTDDRVRVMQILSVGGKAVQKAAQDALEENSRESITHFLEVGQYTARDEDNRFEILRIISDKKTGPGVQKGAQQAMDGTAADRQKFLDTERHALKIIDNRVLVRKIIGAGGPEVRAAGIAALKGSPEDVQKFIDEGQFTARAKDEKNAEDSKGSKDSKDSKDSKGENGGKDAKGGDKGKGQGTKPAAEHQKQDGEDGAVRPVAAGGGARPAGGSAEQATTGAQPESADGHLAATGANGSLPWAAGGTAVALGAGAGLIALSRRRAGAQR
ncbi:ALF repeat-containing protein [Streptomyces sp. NPDC050610]|uniref:ALF repeat-containing protein n=1 Tax=Streptomyces sp. NPDC050610 TaxID=3157097 RepID=UPI0034408C2F